MSNGPNAQSPTSGGGGFSGQGASAGGGQGQPVQLSKPKLAQFRYGREEMLALYTSDIDQPPEANEFSSLFREKPIEPINLTAVTEEEQVGASPCIVYE